MDLICIFPSFADEPKGATASKPSTTKKKESEHRIVYTVASKQMLISLAPPVLTLHLKRFQQARFTLRKLTKHVDFPVELNLASFCSRSGRVCDEYGLDPDIVRASFCCLVTSACWKVIWRLSDEAKWCLGVV